jgi:uncharacterized membrane protein HdeD (DUF308 family)
MNELLARSWWMLALQGALALTFGILAIVWPASTLIVLVAFFAAWALLGGAASVIASIQHRKTDEGWWLVLLLGIVSLAAGAIAVFNPDITILVLVLLMGANALVSGVLQIVMAVRLRKEIRSEWLLALAGAIAVAFGIMVILFPAVGAFAMVWIVSFYATLTGILLLTLAFRARRWITRTGGAGSVPDASIGHPGPAH